MAPSRIHESYLNFGALNFLGIEIAPTLPDPAREPFHRFARALCFAEFDNSNFFFKFMPRVEVPALSEFLPFRRGSRMMSRESKRFET